MSVHWTFRSIYAERRESPDHLVRVKTALWWDGPKQKGFESVLNAGATIVVIVLQRRNSQGHEWPEEDADNTWHVFDPLPRTKGEALRAAIELHDRRCDEHFRDHEAPPRERI